MNRTAEVAAVAAVMDAYIAGTRNRDVASLKKIFHKDALMTGYFGSHLGIGSPQPFFDELETNEIAADYAAQVTSVEVIGATAMGQIVEDNLMGLSFVNNFHLIKVDGAWLIISKLYHHDNPEG